MQLLIYFTKGLSDIVKKELNEKVPGSKTIRESPKYLAVEVENPDLERFLDLKTADDVHYLVDFQELEEKPSEEDVLDHFDVVGIEKGLQTVGSLRSTGESFSLTVSRYRNDRADLDRLEARIKEEVSDFTQTKYAEKNHSEFDIRIHLEENKVLISCRLTEKPLYFRSYWKKGRKGSLKTSIAAALVKIADPDKDSKLVDNFCGAGTILCEAYLQDLEPSGGDIEREAVECSRENLEQLSPEASRNVKKLDARSTGQPDSSFDLAVSNLPWGKQVDLNAVEIYSKSIGEYSRILREDASLVILGTEPDLAEKHIRKNFPEHEIERFRLGFLGQNPTVIHAFSGD